MKLIKKVAMIMMVATMIGSTTYATERVQISQKEQVVDTEKSWLEQQKAFVESIRQKGEAVGKSVTEDGMILTIENVYRDSYCMYTLCSLKKEDHTTMSRQLNVGANGEYQLQCVEISLKQTENTTDRPNGQGQEILVCAEGISTSDTIYFVIINRTTVAYHLEQQVQIQINGVSYSIYQKSKKPQNEAVIKSASTFDLTLTKQEKVINKDNINQPVMNSGKKVANLKQVILTPAQLLLHINDINGVLGIDDKNKVQVKMKDGTICNVKPVGCTGSEASDEEGHGGNNAESISTFTYQMGLINVDEIEGILIDGKNYAVK